MMKLYIWNTKNATFELKTFVTPTFVLDEKMFALRVQGEHIEYMTDVLTAAAVKAKETADALTTTAGETKLAAVKAKQELEQARRIEIATKAGAKALATEKAEQAAKIATEKAEQAEQAEQAAAKARAKAVDAAAALALFTAAEKPDSEQADAISTAYASAVSISKVTFESCEKIANKVKEYSFKYLGIDAFGDVRKQDVLTARRIVNTWLADVFGNRDAVYKVHPFELNAKWFDTVAAAALGVVRPDTVALADGDAVALNLKPLKRDAIALVIVRAMFAKYGCMVVKAEQAATVKKHNL